MEITIGILFLLFGLKVTALYWAYSWAFIIMVGILNAAKDKENKPYDKMKFRTMGLYPIMLLLDTNAAFFSKYGYVHLDWLNFIPALSWTILVLGILCGIVALAKGDR